MRRVVPLICVCLLLTTTAAPAFAQQRLFAMEREVVELDPRPGSLGTVIRRFPLPAEAYAGNRDVVPLGGGQFLAWSLGDRLVMLNTHSGAVQLFNVPDFHLNRVIGTDGIARLLVLGWVGEESRRNLLLVADVRSGNMRFLDLGDLGYDFVANRRPIAYAPASDVLFVARPDFYHHVDVIHVSTGVLVKTLDISPVSADVLMTNAAGTRLFVTDALDGTFAFDVVSGALSASNTSTIALSSTLRTATFDERRNRLIVSVEPTLTGFGDSIGISAFSADSLQFIGRVRVPELPLPSPPPDHSAGLTQEIDISGLSATLFVLQAVEVRGHYFGSTCHESQLFALEVDTGQVRQTVSTTDALGPIACHADLVRITEPAPPPAPSAEVAGHQVTLKWQAPFGATEYEIEAGSAPGRVDRARVRVTDPQLVVDDVPSGVYYVRVRAINTIGKSDASREIQVVVP